MAVKMLKPHHNGSEHAEADLLSEYNLLKEVSQSGQILIKTHICSLGDPGAGRYGNSSVS